MSSTMTNIPWYKQVSRSQWNTFLGSWLGWALDGMDFVLITYVLTDIAKSFSISLSQASTLILATFATRWLGGAIIGSIADKIGRKQAMIWGILIYSVATFLCGVAWNYTSMLVFRLIVGIGMAGEYSAGTTLLIESWPEKARNIASGLLVSGWAIGGLLASSLFAFIVPNFGWRALFYVGIAPAILTIFIRLGVSESQEWEAAKKRGETEDVSFFKLFSREWFMMAFAMFFFMFASFGMNWPILSLMPTYLKLIGYDPAGVGKIMFIANFGALLGYWFSGFFAEKVGTKRAVVSTLLVSLIFVLMVFMMGKSNVITLGVVMFLVEFTSQGITGIWPKYIAEQFGAGVRSAGLGVTYNLGSIAGGLSPLWASALQKSMGLGWALAVLVFSWTLIEAAFVGLDVPGIVRRKTEASLKISY